MASLPDPLAWPDIRERIAEAVASVMSGDWQVTKYIPTEPDSPAVFVDYPTTAERASLKGHWSYEVNAVFYVSLTDPELAQELLDPFWSADFLDELADALAAVELKVTVSQPSPPEERALASGAPMLRVDLPLEFIA